MLLLWRDSTGSSPVPDNKRSRWHRTVFKLLYWARRLFLGDSSDRFFNTMPNVNRAILSELATGGYDVLFAEYWYWDARVFRFPGYKVIDADDVQTMRVESLLERTRNPVERLLRPWLLSRYRRMETEGLARADLVVATTPRDQTVFRRILPARVETVVVPTGLDTDYFVPQPDIEPDPRFEIELSAFLKKTMSSLDLLALYERFSHGVSQFDGLMRRAIWRSACRRFGNGVTIGVGVGFKHLENFDAKEIITLLSDINRKEKRTLVVATHDEKIFDTADYAYTIEDGKLKPEDKSSLLQQ